MRHLLLSEEWFPGLGGSIQLFDALYVRHAPPDDFVHVLSGSSPGAGALDAEYPRPVTRFDRRRHVWLKPESLALYGNLLANALLLAKRDRVGCVHAGRVIPEGLVAYALHRALGVPYVVWVHGEEVSMYRNYAVKKRLMPEVFGHARAVLCNSSFSRDRAIEAGAPASRVHVVNPCVDADRFDGTGNGAGIRARFGLGNRPVLLTVGRLTKRKGHDRVLDALAAMKRPDIAWLVASDGECEAELHAQCKALGLDAQVHFVGPVRSTELPDYYAAADVFIMANRTLGDGDVEGFGMVFLEASAAGRAVIGGRSGGVPDAVNEGVSGLLVDGDDPGDIARAITKLVDDEALRSRLGSQGRAWVRERFRWEEASSRVMALARGGAPVHAAVTPRQETAREVEAML